MLRIEHLTKKYGDKKAVDDLSLHIQKGEIYGFIGHNGAGKTTTIKSCCGISPRQDKFMTEKPPTILYSMGAFSISDMTPSL